MQENTLIYQAYGSKGILQEAVLSVYSLLRQQEPLPRIVIYTDQADYLRRLLPAEIEYRTLTEEKLQRWRGHFNFVHRVKVCLLLDACQHYKGNVLYLDTDTLIEQPLTQLFKKIADGKLLMHTHEGQISSNGSKLNRKVYRYLKKITLEVNGKPFSFPKKPGMYNAGMLGFRSTQSAYLENVLSLTDQLYAGYQKHVMEQLAFSLVFCQAGETLETAEDTVFHYWDLKEGRILLNHFFAHYQDLPLEERIKKIDQLKFPVLMAEKLAYKAKPSVYRNWLKLRGKEWKLPHPEFS